MVKYSQSKECTNELHDKPIIECEYLDYRFCIDNKYLR